jgi:hypothetical protein
MKAKRLRFGKGFRIAFNTPKAQAAEMVIAPAAWTKQTRQIASYRTTQVAPSASGKARLRRRILELAG